VKAFFIKSRNGAFYPNNEETRLYVQRRKPGTIISAEIKIARNYENHKRFFSFIKTTFDMQEHFEIMEIYRKWITMKAGYFDTIVTPSGSTIFAAKSISFESMDEDEFKALFDTAINVFLKELGNGITESELMRVIDYG